MKTIFIDYCDAGSSEKFHLSGFEVNFFAVHSADFQGLVCLHKQKKIKKQYVRRMLKRTLTILSCFTLFY